MKPYLEDGDLTLYHGDALTVLQSLPAGIAQTCVTSPPYWGLRDYGTGQWAGGDETCDHQGPPMRTNNKPVDSAATFHGGTNRATEPWPDGVCGKCGARRVDSQLGLEATPTLYVENMVTLFREVWRVLADSGTLWINLGDSYNANQGAGFNGQKRQDHANRHTVQKRTGFKPKDLVGIPWRVAFALQADGWYLRSDIIWAKPNPMPESVTDRPTKAHEYLFLFSKQPRYFYDADAIREPQQTADRSEFYDPDDMPEEKTPTWGIDGSQSLRDKGRAPRLLNPAGRNRRSVWTIPTQPFPEAHFATYPEELVRPCILAGTSERGECVECGAPWMRVVEHEADIQGSGRTHIAGGWDHGWEGTPRASISAKTLGWKPSCCCGSLSTYRTVPPRPQLVLDPFIGSGTTSLVARKHGRRSLGIDLSAEYLAIAAKRTQQLSLLGTG